MHSRFRRGIIVFLLTLAALLAIEGALYSGSAGRPWLTPVGACALGLFTAVWAFIGGLGLLRRVLRLELTAFAVARVVLEESMRRKIAVTCATILLSAIVVLPFVLDSNAQIAYRVQSFLTYSLSLTTVLLSIITMFLACASISEEIEDRRIHTVLVKPVRRSEYLLGKLLGILLLNLLLLSVSGTAIFAIAHLQVAREAQVEGRHGIDTGQLRRIYEEVLIARATLLPSPPAGYLENAAERAIFEPSNSDRIKELGGVEEFRLAAMEEARRQWRLVQPGDRLPYVYRGLSRAIEEAPDKTFLRLRARTFIGRSSQQDPLELILHFEDGQERFPLASKEVKLIPIAQYLDGDSLQVIIENPAASPGSDSRSGSVMFTPGEGLPQVIFPVGGFAGNLTRALLIMWCRLGFLAALGVCASTFLGFPVACLFTLMLSLTAAASAHLVEESSASRGGHAVHSHSGSHAGDDHEEDGGVLEAFEEAGFVLAGILREFSRYPVISKVLDGRVVPWSEVARIWFRVGLLWSGVLVGIGVFLFQRREVAAVQI